MDPHTVVYKHMTRTAEVKYTLQAVEALYGKHAVNLPWGKEPPKGYEPVVPEFLLSKYFENERLLQTAVVDSYVKNHKLSVAKFTAIATNKKAMGAFKRSKLGKKMEKDGFEFGGQQFKPEDLNGRVVNTKHGSRVDLIERMAEMEAAANTIGHWTNSASNLHMVEIIKKKFDKWIGKEFAKGKPVYKKDPNTGKRVVVGHKGGAQTYVPKEINNIVKLQLQSLTGGSRVYKTLLNQYRFMALNLFPRFYINNALGNSILTLFSGAAHPKYWEAKNVSLNKLPEATQNIINQDPNGYVSALFRQAGIGRGIMKWSGKFMDAFQTYIEGHPRLMAMAKGLDIAKASRRMSDTLKAGGDFDLGVAASLEVGIKALRKVQFEHSKRGNRARAAVKEMTASAQKLVELERAAAETLSALDVMKSKAGTSGGEKMLGSLTRAEGLIDEFIDSLIKKHGGSEQTPMIKEFRALMEEGLTLTELKMISEYIGGPEKVLHVDMVGGMAGDRVAWVDSRRSLQGHDAFSLNEPPWLMPRDEFMKTAHPMIHGTTREFKQFDVDVAKDATRLGEEASNALVKERRHHMAEDNPEGRLVAKYFAEAAGSEGARRVTHSPNWRKVRLDRRGLAGLTRAEQFKALRKQMGPQKMTTYDFVHLNKTATDGLPKDLNRIDDVLNYGEKPDGRGSSGYDNVSSEVVELVKDIHTAKSKVLEVLTETTSSRIPAKLQAENMARMEVALAELRGIIESDLALVKPVDLPRINDAFYDVSLIRNKDLKPRYNDAIGHLLDMDEALIDLRIGEYGMLKFEDALLSIGRLEHKFKSKTPKEWSKYTHESPTHPGLALSYAKPRKRPGKYVKPEVFTREAAKITSALDKVGDGASLSRGERGLLRSLIEVTRSLTEPMTSMSGKIKWQREMMEGRKPWVDAVDMMKERIRTEADIFLRGRRGSHPDLIKSLDSVISEMKRSGSKGGNAHLQDIRDLWESIRARNASKAESILDRMGGEYREFTESTSIYHYVFQQKGQRTQPLDFDMVRVKDPKEIPEYIWRQIDPKYAAETGVIKGPVPLENQQPGWPVRFYEPNSRGRIIESNIYGKTLDLKNPPAQLVNLLKNIMLEQHMLPFARHMVKYGTHRGLRTSMAPEGMLQAIYESVISEYGRVGPTSFTGGVASTTHGLPGVKPRQQIRRRGWSQSRVESYAARQESRLIEKIADDMASYWVNNPESFRIGRMGISAHPETAKGLVEYARRNNYGNIKLEDILFGYHNKPWNIDSGGFSHKPGLYREDARLVLQEFAGYGRDAHREFVTNAVMEGKPVPRYNIEQYGLEDMVNPKINQRPSDAFEDLAGAVGMESLPVRGLMDKLRTELREVLGTAEKYDALDKYVRNPRWSEDVGPAGLRNLGIDDADIAVAAKEAAQFQGKFDRKSSKLKNLNLRMENLSTSNQVRKLDSYLEEVAPNKLDRIRAEMMEESIHYMEKFFGNYNSMHPYEKMIVRNIFPFWTFPKTMFQLAWRLPGLRPANALLWREFSEFMFNGTDTNEIDSRLHNSLIIGGYENGDLLVLRYGSWNPFDGNRMIRVGNHPIFPQGMNPFNANPLLKISIETLFGRNTFTGGAASYSPWMNTTGEIMEPDPTDPGRFRRRTPQRPFLESVAESLFPHWRVMREFTDPNYKLRQDVEGNYPYDRSRWWGMMRLLGVSIDRKDPRKMAEMEAAYRRRLIRQIKSVMKWQPPEERVVADKYLKWYMMNMDRGDNWLTNPRY